MIIIYITYPDLRSAKNLTVHLLKQRLIACANFFPIHNAYWWKGKIEQGKEVVAIVKTSNNNWSRVKTEVKKLHPYETPCILKIHAQANTEYETWVNGEVK